VVDYWAGLATEVDTDAICAETDAGLGRNKAGGLFAVFLAIEHVERIDARSGEKIIGVFRLRANSKQCSDPTRLF
jgi:hypothetical protein